MAGAFDCSLIGHSDSLDLTGTTLGAAEPEFVHLEVDNERSATDGDGCEFTIGVLIDAVAPFDGRTIPLTENFSKLFTIDFEVSVDALCGACLPIRFRSGVDGNGDVPVKNLVSSEFMAVAPQLFNCDICVTGSPVFIRGDCNFASNPWSAVDISDAAAAMGFIFLQGAEKFDAPL